MTDEEKWDPSLTYVELDLVKNHPLSPGSFALVCMDRGSGFTVPKIQRFLNVGGDEIDNSTHGGASAKQIGRFAYFALNSKNVDRDRDSGFYILTRTSSSGPVMLVEVTPYKIRYNQVKPRMVGPDADELGKYKNIKGSFTIVVIPNSVIISIKEIREGLQWKLPRKADRAINLSVGGEPLNAPPLKKKVIAHDGIEVYMDKPKAVDDPNASGLWVCDGATGLRCGYAPEMIGLLPWVLTNRGLEGDIFVNDMNLLLWQDTSRAGLLVKLARTKQWKAVYRALEKAVPYANKLLGDSDSGERDSFHKLLDDFTEMFTAAFGEADIDLDSLRSNTPGPIRKRKRNRRQHASADPKPRNPGGNGSSRKPQENESDDRDDEGRNLPLAWNIGGRSYIVQTLPGMSTHMFALVPVIGTQICLNPDYEFKHPTSKVAAAEHYLMLVLQAVAINREPNNFLKVAELVGKFRLELLQAKKNDT
ncbi:MAG: hypothetical protein ACOYUZ_04550 [Patescibacteria group bacterium]